MSIPANIIIIWSGAINEIPNGWLLCDGTNGTPDLRNRFIVGAGDTYSLNNIGGNADAIVVEHTHTGTLATSQNHTHTYLTGQSTFNVGSRVGAITAAANITKVVGAGTSNHNHTVTIDNAGEDGTNKNLPPYYALAYIMKGGQ